MLRPLFAQQKCRHGRLGPALKCALRWWLEVLSLELKQERAWCLPYDEVVHLFADARGEPPRLAAVLCVDGKMLYSDWEPPPSLLRCFQSRADNQILGLELLAVALGMSTFSAECAGRKVQLWSDNTGAESSLRAATAKSWDHTCIVHSLWMQAAKLGCHLRVDRVPSSLNLSDLPSREEYELLRKLGAKWCQPCLDDVFWRPDAWENLRMRRRLKLNRKASDPSLRSPVFAYLCQACVHSGGAYEDDALACA